MRAFTSKIKSLIWIIVSDRVVALNLLWTFAYSVSVLLGIARELNSILLIRLIILLRIPRMLIWQICYILRQ